ncbi:hypothetical protein B0H66DRAFT_248640 [Apodospora peruviana]|uniref:Uncharacterized protein n=1 Tax=Apodospora peruviana TaxID=516989 RepID=A0AAE0M5L6_9PEZI|nr:hypothetical protein B0H66DRAFT_248640 [Apodospora peruviana]
MPLTTASQLVSRTRSRAASLGALGSPGAAAATVVICHRQQQMRAFRFGRIWSSHVDPELREVCRRHRHLRHKYVENLNRRLSWDQHPLADDARSALKRVVKGYWYPETANRIRGARYVNMDASPKTPDNPDGVRPGQNIEDAERAPVEDFLFGHQAHHNARRSDKGQSLFSKSKKGRRGQKHGVRLSEPDVEYTIDPITNRKVFQAPLDNAFSTTEAGVEIPVKSFKSYRSQFAPFSPPLEDTQSPIFYDGPPPEAELKKYDQVKIDTAPWDEPSRVSGQSESSVRIEPVSDILDALTWKHNSVFWHHGDGITQASGTSAATSWTLDAGNPEYKDLDKYKPVVDAVSPALNEETTQMYKDLDKYKPVVDEVSPALVGETTQKYEDLDKYNAVRHQEPDGKAPEEAPVQEYRDLDRYGAVKSHEPDGKYKAREDSATEKYEDLDKYGVVNMPDVDGKHIMREAPVVPQYGDLDKYGAVKSHEPDGKYKVQEDTAGSQYDDLHEYGAVKSHEPDGKYKADVEAQVESEVDATELSKYQPFRSHEPDGKYAASYVEPSYDAEELARYAPFRSHEPDGKYAASYVQPAEDRVESARYQAFRSHEPDGKYAASYAEPSEDRVESARYQAYRSHEPDGKYSVNYEKEPRCGSTELGTYGAFRSHEPDGIYARDYTTSASQSSELGKYRAFLSHEPDGKYAAGKESNTELPDLGNHEAFGYEDAETKIPPTVYEGSEEVAELEKYKAVLHNEPDGKPVWQVDEDNYDPAELRRYKDVRWNEPDGKPAQEQPASDINSEELSQYRKLQELLMVRSATELPVEDAVASANSASQQSKGLTGNYVQDFPEEFAKKWTAGPDSPLLPTDLETASAQESQGQNVLKHVFVKPPNALQPALDRHQNPGRSLAGKAGTVDSFSKEPQGLETAYVEECGERVPVYAATYGPANSDLESTPQTLTPSEAASLEPTVYKILVHDPTMQSIEIAETTSIVHDNAAPMTPADVLLRISNPAKFFPHFAPLQAQGYEIVSGGGDVLIFRKVRGAVADQAAMKSTAVDTVIPAPTVAAVNPIDMTGSRIVDYNVAAGRFASPTGFVNYDLPPPPPRFVSNIDVRREEPVFSGSKEQAKDERTSRDKTKSLPKRLVVGAAWVAGVSYSLAVVGDYFKTGGVDRKGPKGRL